MGYLRYSAHVLTGTATGVAVGGEVTGSQVFIGTSKKVLQHLSSIDAVTAATSSLTLAHKWEVSNDASTWFDLAHEPQNPAGVVLATGTTTLVTKAVPAPDALYGYKFARTAIVVGGDTGTSDDLWSVSYSYRKLDSGEGLESHSRFNAHIATGTATGVVAGSQVNGNTLFMGGRHQKVENLSALVTVDAETNTLTLAAKWEGSNDKTTWVTLAHAPQNPAAVVLATGTAGSDAAVTKAIPAPASVYGYKFARCSLVVGAVTGTSNDTYSVAYCYRQSNPGGFVQG